MSRMELLCKATVNEHGEVKFESQKSTGMTLSQTIEDDKRYGKMKPANDLYFTYAVFNEDDEFTEKQIHRAVRYAYQKWNLYGKLPKLKRVPKDYTGIIDFKLEFRTVESDPDKKLTSNTIMYHYYPINKLDHPLRGLCVINKRFFFTSHGNAVSGEEFIMHGIQAFPANQYKSIDFDVVYCHELGHGLGLPHDTNPDSIMSTPYSTISEMPSMRDQSRIKSKYGHRSISAWHLFRWLRWLRVASDRP